MQKEKKITYKGQSRKFLVLVVALALVVGIATGGTLAWLLDTSDQIVNTFTHSDITITLTETDADEDGSNLANKYQMIPGYKIAKDPMVTVAGGSETCYVFVKLVKSANYEQYLYEYTIAEGWTELSLSGVEGVYYRIAKKSTDNQDFYILAGEGNQSFKNGYLTVKDTVTKTAMTEIKNGGQPTLTVQAFACQYMKNNTENHKPIDAWNLVKPADGSGS